MNESPSPGICCNVPVVFVLKENAKSLKSALEEAKLLDKNFRMVPSESNQDTIALPVMDSFELRSPWQDLIVGRGSQLCPYSTKVMGRQRHSFTPEHKLFTTMVPVHQAIFRTVEKLCGIPNIFKNKIAYDNLLQRIKKLGTTLCPNSLELFGDDRTVVIPPGAFHGRDFWSALQVTEIEINMDKEEYLITTEFWTQLAAVHGSQRVVRRGTIDANCGIRHSGHRLLFPCSGIPEDTGPGSPGWIQVTEQGIKQSFDMTRVMFSRGNISEKIRFGKLVKKDESVLDMYAGIGYYTLPALIHGRAQQVVACEWNEHAILALRYNVKDNKVEDRVTIFHGDCRRTIAENNLVDMFDRVSLGLLPSSEGGWKAAVCALKTITGGWLHIHGNVPNAEKQNWAIWVCKRLLDICIEFDKPKDWLVICHHVEKVKSFAPTVSHFVADVFLGRRESYPGVLESSNRRAAVLFDGRYIQCPDDVAMPSCALSADGVLSQSWMM